MKHTDTGQDPEVMPRQESRAGDAGAQDRLRRHEEELERIRRKRRGTDDRQRLRQALNMIFLLLAAVGLALYFCSDNYHMAAIAIIGVGMLMKVGEFFVRFFM